MTAAVMFFFFAVSCTWILINVLLTIIIESFEAVKQELNAKGNQYEILDFLKTHGRYLKICSYVPILLFLFSEKNDEIIFIL